MSQLDDEIKKDVIEQLNWDSRVVADQIRVTVIDNVVVLKGHVPTYWAKMAAGEDSEMIAGVKRVDNLLDVQWLPDREPPDEDIGQKVQQALEANPNVDASRVSVEASEGLVLLKGSVDSLWRKHLIEHVASDVDGVRTVDNQLTIVPTAVVEDEELSAHIRIAIGRNVMVEAEEIEVHVAGGTATLSGQISSRAAQRAAFDIAIHTAGVIKVDDQLIVSERITVNQ